jgi:Predicted nucleoside-diphosphate-sugar epimerases
MILVTGATGTVGSEVVKRLSAQGRQVSALTRDLHKAEANPLPHVEFVQGDFDDPDSMRRVCSGTERAFLLFNSTEGAEQQQTDFVEVARTSGVRHQVKLSQFNKEDCNESVLHRNSCGVRFGTLVRSRGHEEDREQGTIHGVVYGPEVGRTS